MALCWCNSPKKALDMFRNTKWRVDESLTEGRQKVSAPAVIKDLRPPAQIYYGLTNLQSALKLQ